MRRSSFERLVGDIPEAEKERILREKAELFDNQQFDIVGAKEREKTPIELRIISLANRFTNDLRRRYGLDDFDIPPENIKIITEDTWPPSSNGLAFYASTLQMVAGREDPSRLGFFHAVVHEMLHFKSYQALQLTSGDDPRVAEYREGLVAFSRDGKRKYFTALNEAVTEELTNSVVREHLDDPLFAEETKTTRALAERYSAYAKTSSGEPLFNDDTYYARVVPRSPWREAIGRLVGVSQKSGTIETRRSGYSRERKMLGALIDALFARNPARFQRRDQVFDLFAKGMMTGNLLPLGRLIDSTFGKGTFRRIGELDGDRDAQLAFVQGLAPRKG